MGPAAAGSVAFHPVSILGLRRSNAHHIVQDIDNRPRKRFEREAPALLQRLH
jgi:hypothetical protein